MYSPAEVDRALGLLAERRSVKAVARETGINRATLQSWREGLRPGAAHRARAKCLRCNRFKSPIPGATEYAYSYLLGLYLGDGTLSRHPRDVYRLRIFLDRAYPVIVGECEAAVAIVMP